MCHFHNAFIVNSMMAMTLVGTSHVVIRPENLGNRDVKLCNLSTRSTTETVESAALSLESAVDVVSRCYCAYRKKQRTRPHRET